MNTIFDSNSQEIVFVPALSVAEVSSSSSSSEATPRTVWPKVNSAPGSTPANQESGRETEQKHVNR